MYIGIGTIVVILVVLLLIGVLRVRAAKKFGVEVGESDWRELFPGGKAKTR